MYESFQALTSVQVTHFVEWFSGSDIGGHWDKENISGTGTFAMADEVDGGFKITTATTANNRNAITHNQINHYDYQNARMIWISKTTESTLRYRIEGFKDNTSYVTNSAIVFDYTGNTYKKLATYGSSTGTSTDSTVTTADSTWRTYEIALTSSDCKLYIDGTLEVTNSTNLPAAALEPFHWIQTDTAASRSLQLRYHESFNTSVAPSSSLYERLSALTQVAGQRVVENFSGSDLQTNRWTKTNRTGSGTFTMEDSVDGGYSITAGSGGNSNINFNGKRQYDEDSSVLVTVGKLNGTSGITIVWALNNTADGGLSNHISIGANTDDDASNFLVASNDGTPSSSSTSVALDTSWHTFKIDNSVSDSKGYIDGVLEVTKTTNLPTDKVQPVFYVGDRATGGKKAFIRYLEAYNKLGTEADYSSVYEMFDALTTVRKSHFWEWFDGDDRDTTRWTFNDIAGTGSGAMADAADEGYQITSGTNAFDRSSISFNDKRHFSETGSVVLGTARRVDANTLCHFGLGDSNDISTGTTNDSAEINDRPAVTYKRLHTADGATGSETDSTVLVGTTYSSYKIECTSSNILATINGVLEVTKTTNRPANRLQPVFLCRSATSGAKNIRIRYIEAYNT